MCQASSTGHPVFEVRPPRGGHWRLIRLYGRRILPGVWALQCVPSALTGRPRCVHLSAPVNCAAVILGVEVFSGSPSSVLRSVDLGGELLSRLVVLFPFLRNCPGAGHAGCIPPPAVCEGVPFSPSWPGPPPSFLLASICFSSVTQPSFDGAVCVSSLEKCIFESCDSCLIELDFFWLLSPKGVLYVFRGLDPNCCKLSVAPQPLEK